MKIAPSRFVLAAEILTIILFHLVKIQQAEKHTAEIAYTQTIKTAPPPKPVAENKRSFEYMLLDLIK